MESDESKRELSQEPNEERKKPSRKRSIKSMVELSPEEEIESYVEDAKERLRLLLKKNPSFAMPDDEMIREAIIMRVKRNRPVKEIMRRLRKNSTVVSTILKGVPGKLDPSFPVQPWEEELRARAEALTSAGINPIPPVKLMTPAVRESEPEESEEPEETQESEETRVSSEQKKLIEQIYSPTPSLTSPNIVLLSQIQPATIARLYSLAMARGYSDIDFWINDSLIPWYLLGDRFKRRLGLPVDQEITPDVLMKLVDTVLDKHARLMATVIKLSQSAQQLSQLTQQITDMEDVREALKMLAVPVQEGGR